MRIHSLLVSTVLLTGMLLIGAPAANAESICIDKTSGEVRVSEICKDNESKGTRVNASPKLSRAQQLQKTIQKLEKDIKTIEEGFQIHLDKIREFAPNVESLENYIKECRTKPEMTTECSYFRDGNLGSYPPTEKQYLALKRVLFKSISELKGYKTIVCKKGNEVLTITDAKPKCPTGYRKK